MTRARNESGSGSPRRQGWRPRVWWSVLAGVVALLTVGPLGLMLVGAAKPEDQVFDGRLLPGTVTFEAFVTVWTKVPFLLYMLNSFLIAAGVTVVSMVFHSMAAFALARLRFPGRDLLFFGFVSTLLVSLPMILVPLFVVVRELGLLNTRVGVAAPMVFQVFALFLLRQFYLRLPSELEDAAKVDGCGYFRLYWNVALPLSRPVLAALSIFVFLGAWNAFLWPLTVTSEESKYVVQTGIASFQGEFSGAWNDILAASTIAAVPTVLLFLLFQRNIVESIKTTGLR